MERISRLLVIFSVLLVLALLFFAVQGWAAPVLDSEFGGHLRVQGLSNWYDKPHVIQLVDDNGPLLDGALDSRLNGTLFVGERIALEANYEAVLSGGESREALRDLARCFPQAQALMTGPPSDDRRLFSLTRVLTDEDEYVSYHRLDRLSATYMGEKVTVRAGRQALTWGNGLIFNPMDLLNPFAPSDVIRDYKTGDDMLVLQSYHGVFSDLQLAYVPRRNLETNEVSGSESSFAGKAKFTLLGSDWDLMAARHFEDTVTGVGMVRYVWNAAWRTDLTFNARRGDFSDGYLSGATNLDYSWIWGGRNLYGLVELYYNGLGNEDILESLKDPDVLVRMDRNELYALGRWYAAGQIQFEAHALVNLFLTAIINLDDSSALFQPRVTWDVLTSTRLMAGVDIPMGPSNTEYGGLDEPITGMSMGPPVKAYVIGTWYF